MLLLLKIQRPYLKQYSETKMAKYGTIQDAQEIAFCNGDIGYRGIVDHINDGVVIIRDEI